MYGIVKFFAAIEILVSVVVLLFGMLAMAQSGLAAISIVGVGLGLLLSGALLYCVGQMVEELIAIRKATEAQAAFFAERFAKPAEARAPSETGNPRHRRGEVPA